MRKILLYEVTMLDDLLVGADRFYESIARFDGEDGSMGLRNGQVEFVRVTRCAVLAAPYVVTWRGGSFKYDTLDEVMRNWLIF